MQDTAYAFAELHEISASSFLQSVEVPPEWQPYTPACRPPSQLGVIHEISEGALHCTVQIVNKDIKEYEIQHWHLRNATNNELPVGFHIPPIITTLWSQQTSHLVINPSGSYLSSLLQGYCRSPCWKPCWSQGKWYPLFNLYYSWYVIKKNKEKKTKQPYMKNIRNAAWNTKKPGIKRTNWLLNSVFRIA